MVLSGELTSVTGAIRGSEAMRQLGASIAQTLEPGDVVLLHGDLGAGKTTLAQGIGAALQVKETLQSPTFNLRSEHSATLADGRAVTLHHLDLHRLDDPEQLVDIGWDELLASEADVIIVEWPERAEGRLPDTYVLVSIGHLDADSRAVAIREVSG